MRCVWFLVLLAACATSCTDPPASPSANVPYSQTDLVVGTGADALSGTTMTVNYTGWLYDTSKADHKGLMFDTSIGKTPFSFTLGAGQVIKGWDQGVVGMKVGGARELVIPPSLAYGSTRSGVIPPNATLLFDITLVSIP
jgi:FKBP-type peptidyl-prolyl cis-trans isomerase